MPITNIEASKGHVLQVHIKSARDSVDDWPWNIRLHPRQAVYVFIDKLAAQRQLRAVTLLQHGHIFIS